MDPTSHQWYHNPPPFSMLPPTFFQPWTTRQTKDHGRNEKNGPAKGPPAGDVQWTTAATTVDNAHTTMNASAAEEVDWDVDGNDNGVGGGGSDDDDDDDDEVSAAFLEFIAQSAAHRKERDRKKQQAEQKRQRGHYSYASSPNPTEAPGAARRRQCNQLYGKGADSVQALEARVNLAHDNSMDAHAPTLWPALPLKM